MDPPPFALRAMADFSYYFARFKSFSDYLNISISGQQLRGLYYFIYCHNKKFQEITLIKCYFDERFRGGLLHIAIKEGVATLYYILIIRTLKMPKNQFFSV